MRRGFKPSGSAARHAAVRGVFETSKLVAKDKLIVGEEGKGALNIKDGGTVRVDDKSLLVTIRERLG